MNIFPKGYLNNLPKNSGINPFNWFTVIKHVEKLAHTSVPSSTAIHVIWASEVHLSANFKVVNSFKIKSKTYCTPIISASRLPRPITRRFDRIFLRQFDLYNIIHEQDITRYM